MRVMLVAHRFPPDGVAGVERITQSLADELASRGDEVSVFARQPGGEMLLPPTFATEQLPNGVRLYRSMGGGEARLDRFLAHAKHLENQFTLALTETMPDVVHILHLLGLSPMFLDVIRRMRIAIAVSMQDFFYACPLILLRKRSGEPCDGPDAGRECVRTCFSHEPASMALRWNHRSTYFRHLLGYANRVICPSRYIFNFFEKLGLDASRVRLIDNAVTIDSIHPLDIQQSHPAQRGCLKLAFLGTISPHKGAHVILNALRHARLGPVELRLIGARGQVPYATRLREEAKDIPDLRMRFYGAYEPRDLPVLLDDVDLAITPSIWPETFAIVVREALVRGVPIAVSRRGGLPEAVKEGENGFTFDPDHPSELTGILRRILSEPELLPRLRRGACASRVMKIAEHADAVRTVYQEAIDDLFAGGTVSLGDVQQVSFLHNVLLGSGFGAEGVKGKVAHG